MSDQTPGRPQLPTIQFLGGTETVTGSRFLLRTAQQKWLVDCGLFQGLKELRLRNWAPMPIKAADLNGVILTHAHIDHTGAIPLLVKQNFHGKIYASEPTVDLCRILLPDAGYIQEEDARYAGRKGFSKHRPPLPLYTKADAERSLEYLVGVHNGDLHHIGDLRFRLIKAGHIVGSRFVEVTLEHPRHRKILFGGDIGRYDSLISAPPLQVPEADYVILEATYGDRTHPKEDIYQRMASIINTTTQRGGKVLISAFAVGRTQQMLYILKKLQKRGMIDRQLPVFLNTPMGIDATDIYARYMDEHRVLTALNGNGNGNGNPFHCDNLRLVHDHEDSRALNDLEGPAIIIAGSGMLTGGRILHHVRTYGSDPRSCLVLMGYQAEGTRGRALAEGQHSLKMHGQEFPIRCQIEVIESLSAHGDQTDIMRWLHGFRRPPKNTFLVHGERSAAEGLAARIREELHWKVTIPHYLDEVSLE